MKLLFKTATLGLLVSFIFSSCSKPLCETCSPNPLTSINKPPVAVAGADQIATLPMDSILLDGSASYDPDGTIIGWQWTNISGPLFFRIENANYPRSQVNDLEAGIYLFELKVTDNEGLSAVDTGQITVMPFLSNPNINNVYIAGWGNSANGKTVARILKNGILENLSNGQNNARANAVFVSGTDVYVAGFDGYDAILWKNGAAQTLMSGGWFPNLDSTAVVTASSVFVSGNDVYVSGNIFNWVQLGGWVEGVLWKNGMVQDLGSPGPDYLANSVYVSNSDVYVAGMVFDFQSRYHATIWKNGIAQFLTDGQHGEIANSVFVAADIEYVAGISANSATVWENGLAMILGPGVANSVFVSDGNLYVAGMKGDAATLWKNGQATILGTGSANSLFVSGNDVYVAGKKDGIATLWKNGVAYTIQGLFDASSVFVK